MKVKICGITSITDGLAAVEAGADLIGLNLYAKSPRYLTPEAAYEIVTALKAELGTNHPIIVGLFVNQIVSTISQVMKTVGFHHVQLSGDESAEVVRELRGTAYKAIRPPSQEEALKDIAHFEGVASPDENIPSLLLDAFHPNLYGGTGVQASVEIAQVVHSKTSRMMLAGGLKPDNVGALVKAIRPWGVDVASGVEIDGKAGKKDALKMRDFVQAAKQE